MTFRRPSRRGVAALAALLLVTATVPAVAATPSARSKCSDAITAANLQNDAGDYAGALAAFDAIVPTCKGKNDRIAIQSGRAHALNRQKRYAEAVTAADAVLAKDDKTHLFALFERAYANEHLGNKDLASADYQQIIALTEKNQNVKERATLYAKMADLNYNAGKTADAEAALAKAVELDPANPSFAIMKGDWAVKAGNYAAADSAYNKAAAMGVSGVEIYQIRSEASLKMVQEKYGTVNAQELRAKMTPQEKALVCTDLNRALALGWKNPQMDMFASLTCR
jgi:tetratricopeptide (TPR) repeat protein